LARPPPSLLRLLRKTWNSPVLRSTASVLRISNECRFIVDWNCSKRSLASLTGNPSPYSAAIRP
jgi:hypothetical protein